MEYLVFIGAIIALVILVKIFSWPLKKIIGLVINVFIGAVLLWIINYFGASFNFSIPFNWITAAIVGFLGIPGVIILAIMQFIV